jgi:regulator of sigma D
MQLMEQAKKLPEYAQDSQIIEDLYLGTLCRYPTASEQSRMLAYIREQKDRKVALEDCLWGLLNAEEFVFNK